MVLNVSPYIRNNNNNENVNQLSVNNINEHARLFCDLVEHYIAKEGFDRKKITTTLREYRKLREKSTTVKQNIRFLIKCKKAGILPNFIKVKTAVDNSRTQRVLRHAEHDWLRQEINYAHYELNEIDKRLYELHRLLTSHIRDDTQHDGHFYELHTRCDESIDATQEASTQDEIQPIIKRPT